MPCGTGEGNAWGYLGQGVLRSLDGGTTWSPLCTTPVLGDGFYALVIDPADAAVVVAGTRNGLCGEGHHHVDQCAVQRIVGTNQTQRYFTFGWPTAWHVVWWMMPTTPVSGALQIDLSVAVERYAADRCTYWLTVVNKTAATVGFEGRYAVLG